MRVWIWVSLSIFLIFIVGTGVYLYSYAGLRQFLRARAIINQISSVEEREKTWSEFVAYDPERIYGGILAGSAFGRVWVWGTEGLRSFVVDEYSVYSWYDGCNSEVLTLLNAGVAGVIEREIYTDLSSWQKNSQVGDYVRAYITMPEMGGTKGNLREIYDYNFWLFMQRGMEERCVK